MNTFTHPPGYFAKVICHAAKQVSLLPLPDKFHVLDKDLIPFVKLLYKQSQHEYDTGKSSVQELPRPKTPKITVGPDVDGGLLGMGNLPYQFKVNKKDKRMLLGFSGGKDSTVSALYYREQGYEVTACFVPNMNRYAPDEGRNCERVCVHLNIPLVTIPLKVAGDSGRRESPLENAVFLALMMDYGLPKGIGHYALGTEEGLPSLADYDTEWNFGDSPYVMATLLPLFQKSTPAYRFHGFDSKVVNLWGYNAYTKILNRKDGMELLYLVGSCMSQYRFRLHWNILNTMKYKVDILPGRCGSCSKCCMEWVYLQALGCVKPNPAYEKHCWKLFDKLNKDNAGLTDAIHVNVERMRREGCTCSKKKYMHPVGQTTG